MNKNEIIEKSKLIDELFPKFFEHDNPNVRSMANMIRIICNTNPRNVGKLALDDYFLANIMLSLIEQDMENGIEVPKSFEEIANKHLDNIADKLRTYEEGLYDIDVLNSVGFSRNSDENSLNFATMDSFANVPCDGDIITKLLVDDCVEDYEIKLEGLYQAVIYPDVNPDIKYKWAFDFVKLTEHVINGEYFTDNTVTSVVNNAEMFGNIYSYQACIIYYINYLGNNKDEESFLQLVRLVYGTIANILGIRELEDSYKYSTDELLNGILEMVNDAYVICEEKNDVGLHLQFIPEYTNTSFGGEWVDGFSEQTSVYAPVALKNVAPIPTPKERICKSIVMRLVDEGFTSDEITEFLGKYESKDGEFKSKVKLYQKLYELGIAQEVLFVLKQAVKNNLPSYNRKFNSLIIKLQDYIYDDRTYNIIEKENDSMSEEAFAQNELNFETNILKNRVNSYNDIILLLNSILDSDHSMEEIFALKNTFVSKVRNRGISENIENALYEINEKILKLLEDKAKNAGSEYDTIYNEVSALFDRYSPKVISKLEGYLGAGILNINDELESIKRALVTGEFLYNQFVKPYIGHSVNTMPENVRNMDFSCIALEYYTALEKLVNLLLYKPYKIKVLCNISDPRNGSLGYLGKTFYAYVTHGRDELVFNESSELGPIARMYKGYRPGDMKYLYVKGYIDDLRCRMDRIALICESLDEVRELRNQSAHGEEILEIGYAKKAQDASFIHLPNPDTSIARNIATITNCHNLIGELLKWFCA